MVDFNNESTITTAPHDIVKIMILERRKYVIDAFEHYARQRANNIQASKAIISSSMLALFMEWRATLKRILTEKDFKELRDKIFNNPTYEQLLEFYEKIDGLLDEKRVIRIDTIKKYDSSNVETENKEKGL